MKTDPAMNRRQLTDPAKIREFALAGEARLTLESAKTGARYTFRVSTPDLKPGETAPSIWFASLLTGSDNEGDYSYFGHIKLRQAGHFFEVGRKSRLPAESAPVKAFAWFWSNLMKGHVSDALRVWHEGRCCRCGRALTVPSSIENGIGPECIKHMDGGFRAETVAPARKPNTAVGTRNECYNALSDGSADDSAFDPAFERPAPTPVKLAGHATAAGWSAKPERKAKPVVMHVRPFNDSLDGLFGAD